LITTLEPHPGTPLTEREFAVLRLIADGYSPLSIAGQTYLSVAAVRRASASTRSVLVAASNAEAVAIAFRAGWLS
jgi:DNA-binding NarL/FixJ family response regulator